MGFSDLEVVMKSLLKDEKYANMTISCQGHIFKAHRAILCSQSSFFDAALKGGFEEADRSLINLPDDVDTISHVLSFCYLQDYSEEDDKEPIGIARSHFSVYLVADRLGISPLQELATARIANWTSSNWELENFAELAEEIWRSIPPHEIKLRALVVETFATHIRHFLAQDKGETVLVKYPDLAVEVLKQVAEQNDKLQKRNSLFYKSKFGRM